MGEEPWSNGVPKLLPGTLLGTCSQLLFASVYQGGPRHLPACTLTFLLPSRNHFGPKNTIPGREEMVLLPNNQGPYHTSVLVTQLLD